MRIISGTYSGRVLASKIPEGTRPTTDMVREALFNSLNHLIILEDAEVLDLFAGTGAIGIEAISRGAKRSVFVENGFKQVQLIKSNLEILNIHSSKFKIVKRNVIDYLAGYKEEEKFDFIFADPPYINNDYTQILELIYSKNLLKPGGLIVFEMIDTKLPLISEQFEILKEKQYGTTKFYFIILKT